MVLCIACNTGGRNKPQVSKSASELALVGTGTKLSFYDAAGGENITAIADGICSSKSESEYRDS